MLCRGTASVNVIDTLGYYGLGAPLYGAAGTCWHDPSAEAKSYRLDCYDDLACFANGGRCTGSGPLYLGLIEQQVKGGQQFWTRCSYGFSARATDVLPGSGSVTCSATYTGSKPNLGIQAGAVVNTSKVVTSTFNVLAPSAGGLTVGGSIGSRLTIRAAAAKPKPAIGTTTVKVKQAGRVQAALKLNKAAQAQLRRTGRMTITLLVRFQPAAGGPEQTRVTTQTLRASVKIKGKRCPKSAKTKRARAKCVTLPKFPKAKKT
jgi:hypothetical protein